MLSRDDVIPELARRLEGVAATAPTPEAYRQKFESFGWEIEIVEPDRLWYVYVVQDHELIEDLKFTLAVVIREGVVRGSLCKILNWENCNRHDYENGTEFRAARK